MAYFMLDLADFPTLAEYLFTLEWKRNTNLFQILNTPPYTNGIWTVHLNDMELYGLDTNIGYFLTSLRRYTDGGWT